MGLAGIPLGFQKNSWVCPEKMLGYLKYKTFSGKLKKVGAFTEIQQVRWVSNPKRLLMPKELGIRGKIGF